MLNASVASGFLANVTTYSTLLHQDWDGELEEDQYVPYADRPETYIVPILFLLILVVGVAGNGVLVLTLLRHANLRNIPNTYVLSLALGDLLVKFYKQLQTIIHTLLHCFTVKYAETENIASKNMDG